MPLRLYTSRITYKGADGIDITAKSALPQDRCFAPSWKILRPLLELRKATEGQGGNVSSSPSTGPSAADIAYAEAYSGYIAAYTDEIRAAYRANRPRFEAVLASDSATFTCYCSDGYVNKKRHLYLYPGYKLAIRCHRIVLALIFVKLGAIYLGER